MKKIKILIFIISIFTKISCLDNGLGRTPQRGLNTKTKFNCIVNEEVIKDYIDDIYSSGLIEAGYKYLIIDDCWQSERDGNGKIVPDSSAFPNGMNAIVEYTHEKGLLFGLYSDAGSVTSNGKPGSLGHEVDDAQTYAEWGVDYLKYDNWKKESTKERYQSMLDALNQVERPIFYSLGQGGEEDLATWGKDVGNSWRTTEDINNNWNSMIEIININNQWYQYAGQGGWNDPDILTIGCDGMSLTEYKTQFNLWAISKAPLIIGCDITTMEEEIKDILKNTEVIAINQDISGEQGKKIKSTQIFLPDDYTFTITNRDLKLVECNGGKRTRMVFRR